jgi:2-hydroxychromene-2-carboxylate isomerase
MSKTVDFYYDFGSPAAYLAWTQMPALCAAAGAALNWRPMLLGGVFKATGNDTPMRVKAKGEWIMKDFARFAGRYGVALNMNPHFIINTLATMRGAVWALRDGCIEPYNRALYTATWVDGRNTGDAYEIAAIVAEAGLDAASMAQAIQTPEIKQGLIAITDEAVARGVFGAPTMFIGDEMHFGQDRLDWVRRALAA